MSRTAKLIAAGVALQGALIAGYMVVEARRAGESTQLGTAAPARMDGLWPDVPITIRDGAALEPRRFERPTLVHFWATWCPPCRDELPGILTLPERHPVDVVAVSLDRDWPAIERFAGSGSGAQLARADGAVVEQFLGVTTLPVTYLVLPGGRQHLRFDGARDWTDPGFVETWLARAAR